MFSPSGYPVLFGNHAGAPANNDPFIYRVLHYVTWLDGMPKHIVSQVCDIVNGKGKQKECPMSIWVFLVKPLRVEMALPACNRPCLTTIPPLAPDDIWYVPPLGPLTTLIYSIAHIIPIGRRIIKVYAAEGFCGIFHYLVSRLPRLHDTALPFPPHALCFLQS